MKPVNSCRHLLSLEALIDMTVLESDIDVDYLKPINGRNCLPNYLDFFHYRTNV